jgi:AcrR family transcriptional regulator
MRRPHHARSHEAIMEATSALLSEVGYAALTIEAVAARAGVGKSTVYRWWPSKGALAIDALSSGQPAPVIDDTGDVRRDLVSAVQGLIARLTSSAEGTIIPAMMADLVRDPELAERFRARLLRPRRALVATVVQRAIRHGDLMADVDVTLFLDACVGAVFYRTVVSGEPITEASADQLVDLLLDGAAPPRPHGHP